MKFTKLVENFILCSEFQQWNYLHHNFCLMSIRLRLLNVAGINVVCATMAGAAALSIGNNDFALRKVKLALLVWKPVKQRYWSDDCPVLDQSHMNPQRRAAQLWLYLGSEINLKFNRGGRLKNTTLLICKIFMILLLCTRIKLYCYTCKTCTAAFACFGPLTWNHTLDIAADHFPDHPPCL